MSPLKNSNFRRTFCVSYEHFLDPTVNVLFILNISGLVLHDKRSATLRDVVVVDSSRVSHAS